MNLSTSLLHGGYRGSKGMGNKKLIQEPARARPLNWLRQAGLFSSCWAGIAGHCKPGHIQTKSFQRLCKKNVPNSLVRWIALQIRQEIECSGQTWLYQYHIYTSFRPLMKTALWRWNFIQKLCSQDIHKWRFTYRFLIQIWRPWIARQNIANC